MLCAGTSHAKGIVVEKIGIEAKQSLALERKLVGDAGVITHCKTVCASMSRVQLRVWRPNSAIRKCCRTRLRMIFVVGKCHWISVSGVQLIKNGKKIAAFVPRCA